jgi:hypothetical protein
MRVHALRLNLAEGVTDVLHIYRRRAQERDRCRPVAHEDLSRDGQATARCSSPALGDSWLRCLTLGPSTNLGFKTCRWDTEPSRLFQRLVSLSQAVN